MTADLKEILNTQFVFFFCFACSGNHTNYELQKAPLKNETHRTCQSDYSHCIHV